VPEQFGADGERKKTLADHHEFQGLEQRELRHGGWAEPPEADLAEANDVRSVQVINHDNEAERGAVHRQLLKRRDAGIDREALAQENEGRFRPGDGRSTDVVRSQNEPQL
jgi:hypothetical protein